MGDTVTPQFDLSRKQIADFVKDPRTIRDVEALARMLREEVPAAITAKVDEARIIDSGAGLTGGGDLSADRTLAVGAGTGIIVNADDVAIDTTAEAERIRDTMGTALVAGTGITITPNDGADTITVASSITQYTDEQVRDAIGAALVAGSNITITVNDGADTITIAASGAGSGSLELISSISADSSTTTFSFTSIPGTYNGLIVQSSLAGNSTLIVRCNNDSSGVAGSSGKYQMQRTGHANGLINLQQLLQTGWNLFAATFGGASTQQDIELRMLNYNIAVKKAAFITMAVGTPGSGSLSCASAAVLWDNTATLTQLDFIYSVAPTSGKIRLFGIV